MSLYTLYKVKIEGFWGDRRIEAKFDDNMNIFVGKNGTGKTTFINILQGVLYVNLRLLSKLQFRTIDILFKKGRSRKRITVSKIEEDLEYKFLEISIGYENYKLPLVDRYYSSRGRISPKLYSAIEEIKSKVSELYNVAYLSVHREIDESEDEEFNRTVSSSKVNSIDRKMRKLMNSLTSYQLGLEQEVTGLSKKFERQVLQSMLFDENIDVFSFQVDKDFEIATLKKGLTQAYRDLKVLNNEVQRRINKHVEKISNAIEKLNSAGPDDTGVHINEILPMILLRRTQNIIKFSQEAAAERTKIYKPITNYLELISEFITDKTFTIDTREGGLIVEKEGGRFPITFLSSGEKQLIILLTEALIQEKKHYIFIADEPEISLHISWQRKILPSLVELNENAQFVIATHSPEIVGKNVSSVINMKNIIK